MRTRLSEFRSLSGQRRRLFCEAAVLLVSGKLLLAVAGLDVAERCLGRLCRLVSHRQRPATATDVRWAIATAAARLPWTYDCLDRALAGSGLLTTNGHQHSLRLGVDTGAGEFEAHAWVESNGEVLIGGVDDFDRFQELS